MRVMRAALVAAASALACGEAAAAELSPLPTASLQPIVTTSELVVGRNRFAFALLKDGSVLSARRVAVRLYDISGDDAQLVSVAPALYYPLEVIEGDRHVHLHPDGTRHLHDSATDVRGIYVAHVTLPRAGPWGVEISVEHAPGVVETTRLSVDALPQSRVPLPGTAAPRSRNRVASDVSDLRLIDSSEPPDPRLHQTRIVDAIRQGRPQVIVFATPKYCTSRVCGPVLDVVRTLIPVWGDRVAFVHEEVWQTGGMQRLSPTMEEWHLRSEPWIFIVDGAGVICARFEGLTTRGELETALREMLRRP